MFHLRRSQFLQSFNSSPDETSFYRLVMVRESVTNTLIMIQPTLMAYSMEAPTQPVLLDATAVTPQRILLLDTFFHVVVFHGDNIAKWKADKIQERPEYDYFAEFLKGPVGDAQAIMAARFPVPAYIECDQGKSASRFLMAKLNPSVTHATQQGYGADQQPVIFTDDVSMRVFLEHLKKYAVSQQ
jgi:protein transport protein SEC23